MREIKFRAWDKENKAMEYDLFGLWGAYCLKDGKLMEIEGPMGEDWSEETDDVLMQYIGIKDSKGTEIYEGDIVESADFDPSVVSFRLGSYYFDDLCITDAFSHEWVVMGNIHKNKRLLK